MIKRNLLSSSTWLRIITIVLVAFMSLLAMTIYFSSILLFTFLLFTLISGIPLYLHFKRKHVYPFEPDLLLSASLFLYSLALPLETLLLSDKTPAEIDLISTVLFLSSIFLLAFYIGYYLVLPKKNTIRVFDPPRFLTDDIPAWLPWSIIVFGLMLYALFIFLEFGSLSSYIFDFGRNERRVMAFGKGWMLVGMYFVNAGWLMLFVKGLWNRIRPGVSRPLKGIILINLIFLIAYTAFFLAQGYRRQWVFLIINLVCVTSIFKKLPFVKIGISGFLLLPLMQFFSQVRGLVTDPERLISHISQNFSWTWLKFSTGELGAPFRTFSTIIRDISFAKLKFGVTYLEALLILVPRIILPDRPLTPSLEYSREYYPHVYEQGGGVAFTILGESFLNFGYFGPLVVGLLFGIACRYFYDLFLSRKNHIIAIVLYAMSIPAVLWAIRSDAATIVKFILLSTISVILPYLFYRLLRNNGSTGKNRTTKV